MRCLLPLLLLLLSLLVTVSHATYDTAMRAHLNVAADCFQHHDRALWQVIMSAYQPPTDGRPVDADLAQRIYALAGALRGSRPLCAAIASAFSTSAGSGDAIATRAHCLASLPGAGRAVVSSQSPLFECLAAVQRAAIVAMAAPAEHEAALAANQQQK